MALLSFIFVFLFLFQIFSFCFSSLPFPHYQGQQAIALMAWQLEVSNTSQLINAEEFLSGLQANVDNNQCYYDSFISNKTMEDDLIRNGLPGQTFNVKFKQYAGYINVDVSRNLFYYFVEADVPDPSTKPLVLWLNGGPGCSSVGIGAMLEVGPFGVNQDGQTLYSSQYAWNKAANMLFLESPAGVGFSYSNNSSDYNRMGDKITAIDNYNFLINWFQRYPQYLERDFYIAGESYAGYYIPELAYIIQLHSAFKIRLKGIMIGNGVMNYLTDIKGNYDYKWSHSLISDETYQGLIDNCFVNEVECACFQRKLVQDVGTGLNLENINAPICLSPTSFKKSPNPCEPMYIHNYLNRPEVQAALNANITQLPYSWEACSVILKKWADSPWSLIPLYQQLINSGLRMLLYGGEADSVVPVIGIRYGLRLLNLTVTKPWHSWLDYDNNQTAGYQVHYDGLSFATVLGAGHQVATDSPSRAFALFRYFLENNL